jgi:hypothetical protein
MDVLGVVAEPVIPATQEVNTGGLNIRGQAGQLMETMSQNKSQKGWRYYISRTVLA